MRSWLAGNFASFTVLMPIAWRVALMLSLMYGPSSALCAGVTRTAWKIFGKTTPTAIARKIHKPTAIAGNTQVRW